MDATPVADAAPQEEPGVEPQPAAPEPIPPPHALDDQGRPVPLPGVAPVFLTGTTVELLGLQPPIPADGTPAPPLTLVAVPKDKVLGDIQVGRPGGGAYYLGAEWWRPCAASSAVRLQEVCRKPAGSACCSVQRRPG
jgi:hypothetical protein